MMTGRVETSYGPYPGGIDSRLPPKWGDWQSAVLPPDSPRHPGGVRRGPIATDTGAGAAEARSRRLPQLLTGHGGQMGLLPVRDLPLPQDKDDLQALGREHPQCRVVPSSARATRPTRWLGG